MDNSRRVFSPMSDGGNIILGLVNGIPSLTDRGSVRSLSERHPIITRRDTIYIDFGLPGTIKEGDPIEWVKVSRYSWEDTITYKRDNYKNDTIWKSDKFDSTIYIPNSSLKFLMQRGIQAGGVYQGVFTWYIHGRSAWAYPTEYVS